MVFDGDDPALPNEAPFMPQECWRVVEDRLIEKNVSGVGILAMQGMFASGYEQGIEGIMRALEGTSTVMEACAVVNEQLRMVREMKEQARAASRAMIALRNMQQVPQEKTNGSTDHQPGPGKGDLGEGVKASDVREVGEDSGSNQSGSGR